MKHWTDVANQLSKQNSPYVLITILGLRGSAPRDSGTKMIITEQQTYASIGGGKLEFMVIDKARQMLDQPYSSQCVEYYPLGPKLGQCCGGSTTVLFEYFSQQHTELMLFGAGHVGHALSKILLDLPIRLHWVDNRAAQFTDTDVHESLSRKRIVISDMPVNEIKDMPPNAYYLIMTHDHQLDFDLCCAILQRNDAAYIGLIGSQTKWQRFRKRLLSKGFAEPQIDQINCPVGLATVPGKRPMEVAVSIAGSVINRYHRDQPNLTQSTQQGIQWKHLSEFNQMRIADTGHEIDSVLENRKRSCEGCNEC